MIKLGNPTNNPVENIETYLKTYWDLSTPLNETRLTWFKYETGPRSVLGPSILIEMGDHYYDESISRTPRVAVYQEIYITPMDSTKSGIEKRHENMWKIRKEIERIIKTYRTQATDIDFIELLKQQYPKSWRVDKQWKIFEVDTLCRWEL